jgi:hypothetical protein
MNKSTRTEMLLVRQKAAVEKFQTLTHMNIRITALQISTPCSLVDRYKRFVGTTTSIDGLEVTAMASHYRRP